MNQIKAVIFDWGGVLIEDPAPGLVEYISNALAVSQQDYRRAYKLFESDFHTGRISEPQFWSEVCEKLNTPEPVVPSLWIEAFEAAYKPRKEMFELVSNLHKNGFKTALLSNTEKPSVEFFRQQKYDMFDLTIFSCEQGIEKPQKQIYLITAQRLSLLPQQCVFIDDRIECVEGANRAGLRGILFQNYPQLINELSLMGLKVL